MKIKFSKYQGTGNDFIIIDNRENNITLSEQQIRTLCARRTNIGADGLMLLEKDNGTSEYYMNYFNSDGKPSSMCGNGGRCIAHYAQSIGFSNHQHFRAPDGHHDAIVTGSEVRLKMGDVTKLEKHATHYLLNTGSPHHVMFMSNVDLIDAYKEGKIIRNNHPYNEEGVNVNFVHKINNTTLKIRTYERGVEDETLSCGTGSVAAAISAYSNKTVLEQHVNLETRGGLLTVSFSAQGDNKYTDIYLRGEAVKVYDGEFTI